MSTLLRAGTIRSIKDVWRDVRPRPSSQPSWVIRDNTWQATRYGLDAVVITDAGGSTAPLRDELYELFQELHPAAQRLGCADDLDVLSEVLERGGSYERPRAVVATGGGLTDVVDAMVTEFAGDRFVRLGEDRNAGP